MAEHEYNIIRIKKIMLARDKELIVNIYDYSRLCFCNIRTELKDLNNKEHNLVETTNQYLN
jgi:hypothetical protein